MIEALSKLPLFHGVTTSMLESVAAICTEQRLSAGERVMSERDDDYDLYLFGPGSVEVSLGSAQDPSHAALTKEWVIGPGEYELFGELNWLKRRGRSATVTCLESTTVWRIDGEVLWDLIDLEPRSGLWFMHNLALLLAERLNDTELYLKQL